MTVRLEDERGEPLAEFWAHPRSGELLAGDHPGTVCLQFLDPYGNSIFNQKQLPVLLAELDALCGRQQDPELARAGRNLISFLERLEGQVHTYVRFLGD